MSLADLTAGGQKRTGRLQVARASVTRPPQGPNDSLAVVLVNYSVTAEYEVPATNWSPPDRVPVIGDVCNVAFDDDGDIWVVRWAVPATLLLEVYDEGNLVSELGVSETIPVSVNGVSVEELSQWLEAT